MQACLVFIDQDQARIIYFNKMLPKHEDGQNIDLSLSKFHTATFDQFTKYNAHYQKAKFNFLEASERQSYTSIFAVLNIKGYRDNQTSNFIKRIRENDSQYRLQQKDFDAILEELVNMFLKLKKEIVLLAQRKDSEYQRISSENRQFFQNRGKTKKFQPYCQPDILINFDLFSMLAKKSYEYQNYPYGYSIQNFIINRIIEKISEVPSNQMVYRTFKTIWEQNYWFIKQTEEMSYFQPLIDLLFLLHLKRKHSVLSKGRSSDKVQKTANNFSLKPKYLSQTQLTNQEPFYFHFCQIVMLKSEFQDLNKKNQVQKIGLKKKMDKVLSEQQSIIRHRQLRRILFSSSVSLRSIIEWWSSLSNSNIIQEQQQHLSKAFQPYYWQFLDQRGLNKSFTSKINMTASGKKMQPSQNLMNLHFCSMALKRLTKVAYIQAIQNRITIQAEQQEPLYLCYFSYDLCQQNLEKNCKVNQEKEMKSEAAVTIFIGIIGFSVAFTVIVNQPFNQYNLHQILATILSTNNKDLYPSSVVFTGFSFSSPCLHEGSTQRIVYFFKKKKKTFLKSDPRPTTYFLHHVVDTFLKKYLTSRKFESQGQFHEELQRQLQRIVARVNFDPAMNQYCMLLFSIEKREDVLEDSQEQLWKMGRACSNFTCPFDTQQYEKLFAQYYSFLLSHTKIQIPSTKASKPNIYQLHSKTKLKHYHYIQTPPNVRQPQEMEDNLQKASNDEEFKQQANKLAQQLCKTFKQKEVIFTSQQIKEILSDLDSFTKEKQTCMRRIRRILRYAVQNMFIYQAYFNEYFQKPQVNTELKIKYEKELEYLRRQYKEQMENINKVHPGKIGSFYERLLKNLDEYPITGSKFYQLSLSMMKRQMGYNYQEEHQDQNPIMLKMQQIPGVKIEERDQNLLYTAKSQLQQSFKELSLQQVEPLGDALDSDSEDDEKQIRSQDKQGQ